MFRLFALATLAALTVTAADKTEFKAGTARIEITPQGPIWMAGYANRKVPSNGVLIPIFAKALAISDNKGHKIIIVTTDLLGLPRSITDEVSARLEKDHGLRRAQLMFNSSHTHTGPVVWGKMFEMYPIPEEEKTKLRNYGRKLTEDLYTVASAALSDMTPVSLHFGQGEAGFAVNRRQFARHGVVIGNNPKGPVDHSVPVVEVRTADGRKKAILFGYACHNTTLTGEHLKISGDYAGYAQIELEKRYPGATALFVLLCAADQNPNPRSKEELAVEHGKELGDAVAKVLDGGMAAIHPPIRSAFTVTDLNFAPHTRDQFEEEAKDKDPFKPMRARKMLAEYDAGNPIRKTPYPVQAIRFHKDFTLLALGGEVVVDYDLRAHREFAKEKLVVAGYSNDVMCYIPSLRILREGGYEGDYSMVYYGMPGKFAEDVEDRIFTAIHKVMKQVGAE